MHVVQRVSKRQVGYGKRMYSPAQRGLVRNSVNRKQEQDGLEGMFNIGKMFTRMFTFKKHSFDFKNILGATGSVIGTIGTGGIGTIVAPKQFGAHGKVAGFLGGTVVPVAALLPQKWTGMTASQRLGGYVSLAAMAAVGAAVAAPAIGGALGIGGTTATGTGLTVAGTAPAGTTVIGSWGTGAASTGIMGTIGSTLSTVGSGLWTGIKAIGSVLPALGGIMGGGGGQAQQGGETYGPPTQDQYAAEQAYLAQQAAQQAYDAQMAAQQNALYMPAGYGPQPATMNTSYGDLRSPYTAITEDGEQVQVDPMTGQVIQPGMSTEMMIGIAAIALAGGIWYMSGSKTTN